MLRAGKLPPSRLHSRIAPELETVLGLILQGRCHNTFEVNMSHGYLCYSWQAFVQQIVHNLSHGYFYYNYYTLPEKRRKRLPHIDNVIQTLFDTDKPRGCRYHHKKAGKANYLYLRYDLQIVILRSDGEEVCSERLEQKFQDIRTTPLAMYVGELRLKLHRKTDGRITVCFTKDCYHELKGKFLDMLEKREIERIKYWFNALNGVPSYAGVIEHKRLLLAMILKNAKRHGIPIKRSDFRLTTRLKKYTVFEKTETD